MIIALAGNPNSGKTTMFNALTGANERVGNWAGVTVDKKIHSVKKSLYSGNDELYAVDLPGAYSMSPFTSEESVTSTYVKTEHPDVIVNIVDATNLSRSLFFTTQLLELNIPVVVALNKTDVNEKKQTVVDVEKLSKMLGCPVLETVSTTGEGAEELMTTVLSLFGKGQTAPFVSDDADVTDKKAAVAADKKRFAFVNGIVKAVELRAVKTNRRSIHDKIDIVLTNRWLGIPIFAVVMFLVFQISQAWLGVWIAEGVEIGGVSIPGLVTLLEAFKEWVGGALAGGNAFLVALLTEGIIGGVSAVVGFLPLVMVMYFLIALLEDCGYMARVSVILDPIFKKVGLSGKSVIPFVVGTGCAVPGIMACRTIHDERERRATAMLAPFMPCGAKLPLISLFVGAFFAESAWIGTAMYFVGIVIIFLCALLVNRITGIKKKYSYFIMELPEYKAPSLWRAVTSMCSRGWSYIVKAGTVILVCNAVVYIMQYFDWHLQMVAEGADTSILATIAGPVAYLLIPMIGFHAWQFAAAAVTGFIAKENVVGTLAVCLGFVINDDLEAASGNEAAASMMGLTKAAALAYMMFNLFSPPCFAAIGAMHSEMKSAKWLFGGIALQIGVGYTVAFWVYQLGTLLTTGSVGAGFVPGLVAVLAMAAVVVILCVRAGRKNVVKPK